MRRTGTLFTQAVRELVHNLAETPFLQASFERVSIWHERHQVMGDPTAQPSLWADTAATVCADTPDLLFFVRPVASAHEFCGQAAATAAGCSGSHSHAAGAAAPGDLAAHYVEGHVGSCCDGHDGHADDLKDAAHIALGMPDDERGASYSRAQGLSVNYYGVVAQSRTQQRLEGCYLIKTVRQMGAGGCHCMHYSFMHVCNGPTLQVQSVQHWL